jgi:hypothetical protein
MNQDRTQADDANQEETTEPRPDYRKPSKLRAAYNDAGGSVKGAAQAFDASRFTVRRYLVEYGIHEPDSRRTYSLAETLENSTPGDVGLDADPAEVR